MKRKTIRILTVLAMLAASPASARFEGKEEVNAPESSKELVQKPATPSAGKPGKQKGFVAGVREAGRDIKMFFRDFGRDAQKSSKEVAKETRQVPGELKKESKLAAESFKNTDDTIVNDAKKGARAVGKAFKQLGQDFKDSSRKTFAKE
jgi:hypothetical protein